MHIEFDKEYLRLCSVGANGQYRVEFKVSTIGYEQIVTICLILELVTTIIKSNNMNKIYTPYDLEPFEPTHPGELLADELEARGLSQRRFAEMIGISCSVLNEVIRGKRPITPELAFKIEAATGTKAYIWVELQTQYNYWTTKKNKKLSVLLDQIRKTVAVL